MTNMSDGITSELQDIIDTASAPFLPEDIDSEEDPPEEEESPEEESEEEDGEEEEPEDDESEEDEDDSDEDPDEVDEDDQDSPDDEDESEDDEEDDEEEDSEPEALSYDPDLVVQRPDGTTTTLRELHEGYLRQEDYTQKTQRVADTYRKMEQWYEGRANNPTGWIAEIAYSQEDPAAAIAGAIKETGNATVLLSQTLRHLVESGEIAEELVEALNLTSISEQAKDQSIHQEVQSLKQQLQARDAAQIQQQELARVEAALNQQWAKVISDNGLEFSSAEEEYQEKIHLLEFARDYGIPDLEVAYAAKTHMSGSVAAIDKPKKGKTPKKRKAAEAAVKKRKTAAMSRKPTGSGGRSRSKAQKSGDTIVQDAAEQALKELDLDL